MIDLILYISDANKHIQSGDEAPAFNEGRHTPFVIRGNEALTLARFESESDADQLTGVEIIGECIDGEAGKEYSFREGGQAKYEKVYNTEPYEVEDGNGGADMVTPPYMMGIFA